ncbi:hypothetical protein ERD95_15300 [Enterobacteriaceae bacterium ML5]|nr:hypothetical protein ERD95_15300 [Enterobacteriaceae bacterium ML5]
MSMAKIKTSEVVEIMLGKTLTYRELRVLFVEKHPNQNMPSLELAPKLRSIVYSLMRSPHADIEQILGRENKYHLKEISSDFYKGGNVKPVGKISTKQSDKQRVRPAMPPEDAECCRMAAIFNQLLMPVRRNYQAVKNDEC